MPIPQGGDGPLRVGPRESAWKNGPQEKGIQQKSRTEFARAGA
jgi:hypothetical protein